MKKGKSYFNETFDFKQPWVGKAVTDSTCFPFDTCREADDMLIRGYRAMEPRKKLEQAEAMSNTVLRLAAARIRKQHSGISEREFRLRLASLWLNRDTMIRAFGWDPQKEGY